MIRHCRTTAVAMVVAGFAVFGSAGSAQAKPNDEQFIDEVNALGIPVGPNDDVPLMGQRVCEMLTGGLTGNPNPVPVVMGVRNALASNGVSRQQASGLICVQPSTSTAPSTLASWGADGRGREGGRVTRCSPRWKQPTPGAAPPPRAAMTAHSGSRAAAAALWTPAAAGSIGGTPTAAAGSVVARPAALES